MTTTEYRQIPLEVFECRHCEEKTQSSDKREIAAQLCKSCLDKRDQYRKENPYKANEKTEINFFGDPFGKERGGRKLICACCLKEYAVVPFSFHDRTESEIALARASFDKMAPFRERSGKFEIKFKVETFDYTNAPKGWTNEIFCKACFENLPQTFSSEIEQTNQAIQIEQEQHAPLEKATQVEKRVNNSLTGITKENPIGAIGFVIVIAASVFALFKFMSTGVTDGWSEASNDSPFWKIVFFILLGISYFVSIPWLRDKGGAFRKLSIVMSWIAGIAFSLFVISIMPSCDPDHGSNSQGELPYYRK